MERTITTDYRLHPHEVFSIEGSEIGNSCDYPVSLHIIVMPDNSIRCQITGIDYPMTAPILRCSLCADCNIPELIESEEVR